MILVLNDNQYLLLEAKAKKTILSPNLFYMMNLIGTTPKTRHDRLTYIKQKNPTARRARMGHSVGKLTRVLPKSCETCHDCIHSPQFSFEPYWERIKHGDNNAHEDR